jgi:hypothetical protein
MKLQEIVDLEKKYKIYMDKDVKRNYFELKKTYKH